MSTLTRGDRPALPHHAPRPPRAWKSRPGKKPLTDERIIGRIVALLKLHPSGLARTELEHRCGLGHYRGELPGILEALIEDGTIAVLPGRRAWVVHYRLAPREGGVL